MLALVVAKANNNVIGSKNALPWYLPADLKRFRQLTSGHIVVMGRKTFDSIIARIGKPLPNRHTVVVTRNTSFSYEGVDVIHSLDDLPDSQEEIFIIGGAELYRQFMDRADRLYVTDIHATIDGDTYFPTIDETWRETSRETHHRDDKHPYDYDFVVYDRV